jgi:Zn-dependent protease
MGCESKSVAGVDACDIVNGLNIVGYLLPTFSFGILAVDLLRNIDVGTIIIQFAVLLFSLSIHEASHAWMADRCGDYTARYLGRVTINPIPHIDPIGTILFPLLQFFANFPLIGWAKPVPINAHHLRNPGRDQVLVSVAGPASNLIAAFVAFVLLAVLKVAFPQVSFLIYSMAKTMVVPSQQSILAPVVGILFFVLVLNLALAMFNIIPIPPLDGHWILYELLPRGAAESLQRFGSYGFIILYALMWMGVFNIIYIPIGWALRLLFIF